jgi:hypothetical protein
MYDLLSSLATFTGGVFLAFVLFVILPMMNTKKLHGLYRKAMKHDILNSESIADLDRVKTRYIKQLAADRYLRSEGGPTDLFRLLNKLVDKQTSILEKRTERHVPSNPRLVGIRKH